MLKFFKSKTAKAVGGLMVAAFLVAGTAQAALTTDQVNAILGLLNSFGADATTVANVQASLTGSTPVVTTSSNAVDFGTSTLKVGSKGQYVKNLQSFLGISADGDFGRQTKAAVMAWQSDNGLTADGYFGALSRAAANAGSGSTSSTGGDTSTGSTTTVTGPVSAVLSADNPASGTIVAGQATADLMHITFTGNGVINSLTFTRGGVSDQNTLSNIYLYDGVTRLTDGYSFNTNSSLTMNNLNLAVNGSRTIAVKADVASSSQDYDLYVTLASFSSGTTVNTVNIKGNDMFIAAAGSLATVTLSGSNTVTGSPTVNAGTSSYTVWRQAVQVNTRSLDFKAANFRITGSAPSDALANVGLYVDGVKAGANATNQFLNGSNYLSFDFSSAPISLTTGTHTIEVRGDIEKGSSYNFTVALQQASDLMITDPQVGVNVAIGSFSASTAGTISIGTGSFTSVVDPTFSSATNITAGASNVAIAKFKIHGYGEDVKVTSLPLTPIMTFTATTSNGTPIVTTGSRTFTVTSSATASVGATVTFAGTTAAVGTITSVTDSTHFVATITTAGASATNNGAVTFASNGLQNVTLYFNGSQIGTQQGWTSGALTYSLGSQMILPAGMDSILEVRADLRTTGGVNYTAGSISADLANFTAEGWTSHASITTLGAATGTVLAMQSGVLGLSKNSGYSNQSANPNTAGVKIGSYVLQNQSTSESIRITTLAVNLAYGANTSSANLSGLKTTETSGNAGTPVQPATAAALNSATNTFSSDFILAPGQVKTIDIIADSSSDTHASAATVISTLTITSIGMTSNVSATSTATVGQTISFKTATFGTPTVVASSSTVAQLIAAANGGSADGSKAVYNFTSANAASTITELTFGVTSGTATYVKVGGVSAPVVGTTAYLTGLNIIVPNGGSGTNVDVYVSYPEVGTNGITSFTSTSALTLTTIKSTSGNTTATKTVSVAAPTMVLVGSKPVITLADSSDSLQNGLVKVAEVTVAADAKGDIKLVTLPVQISTTPGSAGVSWDGTANAVIVKDTNGTVIASTSAGVGVASGSCLGAETAKTGVCTATVTLTGDYLITAGTSKTFRVYATAAAVAGAVNTMSLSTTLGANTGFTWKDVAGNNITAIDGASIFNYPTTTSVINN